MSSHFRRNSLFDLSLLERPPEPSNDFKLDSKIASKTQAITNKILEDWSHRIESCAHEAQDEHLYPLESDLLDLRDEILDLLHKNL